MVPGIWAPERRGIIRFDQKKKKEVAWEENTELAARLLEKRKKGGKKR